MKVQNICFLAVAVFASASAFADSNGHTYNVRCWAGPTPIYQVDRAYEVIVHTNDVSVWLTEGSFGGSSGPDAVITTQQTYCIVTRNESKIGPHPGFAELRDGREQVMSPASKAEVRSFMRAPVRSGYDVVELEQGGGIALASALGIPVVASP